MAYDELQKYRDQEANAPSWAPYLRDLGQLFADCMSLMASTDSRPTAADGLTMA